jgi:hypothetical protein
VHPLARLGRLLDEERELGAVGRDRTGGQAIPFSPPLTASARQRCPAGRRVRRGSSEGCPAVRPRACAVTAEVVSAASVRATASRRMRLHGWHAPGRGCARKPGSSGGRWAGRLADASGATASHEARLPGARASVPEPVHERLAEVEVGAVLVRAHAPTLPRSRPACTYGTPRLEAPAPSSRSSPR